MKLSNAWLARSFVAVTFTASTSILALANPCPGQVCVGQYVIDSSNQVTRVRQIDGTEIIYRRNYQDVRIPISSVSPEIEQRDDGVRPRIRVMDQSERMGMVQRVFANRKVLYRYNYQDLISTAVWAEVERRDDRVTRGGYVIDTSNREGLVSRIFANRKVVYTSNYTTYISANVSPAIDELNGVQRGTYVVDVQNRAGRVNRVYRNQVVSFTANRQTYYLQPRCLT